MLAELIATTRARIVRNRGLVRETRLRVARGRRRLNPWFALAGGSDPSDQALRNTVRALLAGGVLRRIDTKVWAGLGTGKCCAVCGDPVTAKQVEFEVAGDTPAVAHIRCFGIWREESQYNAAKE